MLTRAIQQINFTANLDRTRNTTVFFIIEKAKKNGLRLFSRNSKILVNMLYSNLIFINIK